MDARNAAAAEKSVAGKVKMKTIVPMITDYGAAFRSVLRKLPIIAAVGVVFAVLTVVWTLNLAPKTYQAVEKLYVTGTSSSIIDLTDLQIGSTLASDYQQIFRNREVHEQIRQRLGLEYTDEELDDMIEVTNPTGRILAITVTSSSPEEAMDMVNEYCEAVSQFIEDRMAGHAPSVFERATLLDTHQGMLKKVAVALMAGGALSAFVLFLLALVKDEITRREQIEKDLGIMVLGALPVFGSAKNAGQENSAGKNK